VNVNGVDYEFEPQVQNDEDSKINTNIFRFSFVEQGRIAFELMKQGKLSEAKKVIEKLKSNISPINEQSKDLLKDISGEVTMGLLDVKNFDKWGKHFIPSIVRAHLMQYCNNFKDPGVQHYGGEMFCKIRDKLDDTFCSMPPPVGTFQKISNRVTTSSSSSHSSSSTSTNQNQFVNYFYDASGGCFDGNCVALMSNQELVPLKNLKKGDLVATPNGISKIVCIVKTVFPQKKAQLVELENGLLSTPYHPIRKKF